ncbi:hypothetical protein [Pasteurella multocida]|uniref:hypothetical protein n=1 Tax=Pasteurella multocida TaxID=747 RepID=UPI000F831076|nr:hypothetical protein [Pasteurella multocida]
MKKWLTLEETAERLSIETGEKITKADILQLGIDQELNISIHIPVDVMAKKCEFITREEFTYRNLGADFIPEMKEVTNSFKENMKLGNVCDGILKGLLNKVDILNEKSLKDGRFMRISPDNTWVLSGVYELELIGNELLDLKWLLNQDMDLPQVDVTMLCGFYIKDKSGNVFEIQSSIYEDKHIELQKEIKSDLKQDISKSNLSKIEKVNSVEEVNGIKFSRKILNYYPCPSINKIEGAFFVVQPEHLSQFINSLEDENSNNLTIDHSIYLLGEILSVVKSKAKKWTQGDLIDEILQQRENQNKTVQGLEIRKIEDYFSVANKKLKSD